MNRKIILFTLISLLLISCKGVSSEADYPISDPEMRRKEKYGKLSGEDGIVLFGGKSEDSASSSAGNSGIGINSYLWRASLDTISFMPISSADPFGGVIITDWYEAPNSKGERFKLNVFITDRELAANAVKVKVFRQVLNGGRWQDSTASEKVANELENKILTRARELRVAKEK